METVLESTPHNGMSERFDLHFCLFQKFNSHHKNDFSFLYFSEKSKLWTYLCNNSIDDDAVKAGQTRIVNFQRLNALHGLCQKH